MAINLVAGNYDIEAYQNSGLDLNITHVGNNDLVIDYSNSYDSDNPDTTHQFALIMWVRSKLDALPDDAVILDSVNQFDIDSGAFPASTWLGSHDGEEPSLVGQIVLQVPEVTDPYNHALPSFNIVITSSVMNEIEGGNYYYDVDLLDRWDVFDWKFAKRTKLMYGQFRVLPAGNRWGVGV